MMAPCCTLGSGPRLPLPRPVIRTRTSAIAVGVVVLVALGLLVQGPEGVAGYGMEGRTLDRAGRIPILRFLHIPKTVRASLGLRQPPSPRVAIL